MTGEFYRGLRRLAWAKRPAGRLFFAVCSGFSPWWTPPPIWALPLLLVITGWPGRWKFLLVPAVTFLLVSLLRRALNRPPPL